jgi:transposase-like protein
MNPHSQFCHNPDCPARGQTGKGNITIHSNKKKRYRCSTCKGTFTETYGTPFYRLHTTMDVVTLVLTLLVHGCPRQAIVAAFGVDERTVAEWQSRAGEHARNVHEHLVESGRMHLQHVQADEIWVKMIGRRVWLAMAIEVPTRLWLGGVVSVQRSKNLIWELMGHVRRAACLCGCCLSRGMLVCVDGFSTYIKAVRGAFRVPLHTGRQGRPRLLLAQGLMLGQVVKQYKNGRVVGVSRRVILGTHSTIKGVLGRTGTGSDINTAYIERLNATFRAMLVPLVRRGRALARTTVQLSAQMWLVGVTYNFCWEHTALRQVSIVGGQLRVRGRTPAMAAGLADQPWTFEQLLTYQVPSPVWVAPKRRGRPPKPKPSKVAQMPQLRLAA